ncbi:MAG: hypothetical protein F6K28_15700 [Microcoleus sp. SIO2G3]|nr:hypothetical protein [Microcoleus sp. SIO2G3]
MKIQLRFVTGAIVLVSAVFVGMSSFIVDRSVEEVPNLEEKLAQVDGATDASEYVRLIDAIDAKCYEDNRTALAGIAITMERMQQIDPTQRVSNLAALKTLQSEANFYTESSDTRQTSCTDILTEWRKAHEAGMQS